MLEKFLQIVNKKHRIDKQQTRYKGSNTYFQGLKDEIAEVEAEIKGNNTVHLEDELGDVLRDYFNLLRALQEEGKITSINSVMKRAENKYTERVETIINTKLKTKARNKIKEEQKIRLQKEHETK